MSDEFEGISYLMDLQHIRCIVERGYADDVVAAAINAGAPAVTVSAGNGTGIREQLGLMGINPKKDVIDVVLSKDLIEAVFVAMIEAGELAVPGRGFIYITDVIKGFPGAPVQEIE